MAQYSVIWPRIVHLCRVQITSHQHLPKEERKKYSLASWLFIACNHSTDPLQEMIVTMKFLPFSKWKYSEGGYSILNPN